MKTIAFNKTYFFLLLFFVFNSSFGQNILLSKEAKVSVLTCGTGNESYSLFGHTAIRISDSLNNIDVVYNYGAFDFGTPNFVAKFTKGDLQYFVVSHIYSDFISQYTYEKRSVYQQELTIPLQLKQQLFDNLNVVLNSNERYYTYKFIDKNCTSMVVDIINKTLKKKVIIKNINTDQTYRSILFPYFDNHFYEKLGTSIIFGKKVDQLGTKIFLPFELLESLKTATFEKNLLAKETQTLLKYEKEIATSWWNNVYSYLIMLILLLLANNRIIDYSFLIIMSLLGIFFLSMGFYSFHQELNYNYNTLLFNPLFLILLYCCFTRNRKWIYRLSMINLVLLFIYTIILITKVHLWIVFPLILTTSIIILKLAIKNKKPIPIII